MKKNRTIVFLLVVFLLLIVVFVKMLSTDNKSDEKKQHEVKTENTEVIKKNEPSIQANSGSKTENSPNRVNVPENKNPNQSIQFENRKSTESDPNTDLDGDSFVGTKDKCPNEYGEINGCPDTDGDGVPDNRDKCPDIPGDKNNFGCKTIQKPIAYNFKMQSQNIFVWNSKIAESGVKAIITVDNYSGKKPKTFDVTGKSTINVVTKDSNYDGVECLITLTIQGDPGFKITGSNQLTETISCSGNNN